MSGLKCVFNLSKQECGKLGIIHFEPPQLRNLGPFYTFKIFGMCLRFQGFIIFFPQILLKAKYQTDTFLLVLVKYARCCLSCS